ncbi:MAG: DUF3828 domain-containing protein [Anaerolineae bacterium]
MKTNRLVNLALALGIAVTAVGCSPVLSAEGATSAEPTPMPTVTAVRVEAESPEEVVRSFYDWYLDYTTGEDFKNPMVDGAYRSRVELAPEFVAEVDALVQHPDGIRFDPFVVAQDVPTDLTVGAAEISGDRATVLVETSFEGHVLSLDLVQVEGLWRISRIARAGQADTPQTVPAVPPDVFVQDFYAWYVDYLRSGSDGPRSPLQDGTYKETGYFTPAYIATLEEMLADEEGLRFDPVLCAQDIPDSFSVTAMHRGETGAMVLAVESNFEGHLIEVTLLAGEQGGWQIDSIRSLSK